MRMPSTQHKQAFQLARHLQDLGDISGMEAQALYRITSVTKVMSMLRNKYNFPIRAEGRFDHTGKRYVRYFLQRDVTCS